MCSRLFRSTFGHFSFSGSVPRRLRCEWWMGVPDMWPIELFLIFLLGDSIARLLSSSMAFHFLFPSSAEAVHRAWNEALINFAPNTSRITCGWKLDFVADTIDLHSQEHYADGAQSVYGSLNMQLLLPQMLAPACASV